jgi:superfamily II DNA/RNA helicase
MLNAVEILQQHRDVTLSHQSVEVRKCMSDACCKMSEGKILPHQWQLDVAESLLLGIDCEVIAPTGAGKTLPFVLPLLVRPDMVIVILSPLDALELDQVHNALCQHK